MGPHGRLDSSGCRENDGNRQLPDARTTRLPPLDVFSSLYGRNNIYSCCSVQSSDHCRCQCGAGWNPGAAVGCRRSSGAKWRWAALPRWAQKMGRALDRYRAKAQGTWLGRGSVDWVKEDTSRVSQLQGVLAGEQPLFLEPSHSCRSSREQPLYQTANLAFTTHRCMRDRFGS
jgi:hypothetical protein